MAKQCEVCGKTPVVGRIHSHANNVTRPALRAQPPARPGDRQRRHPPHPGLHPLHPVEQGRQGQREAASCPCQRVDAAKRVMPTHPNAPAAIGPYSQAIKAGGFLFVVRPDSARSRHWRAGRGRHCRTDAPRPEESGRDSRSGRLVVRRVVKTTVYLADMSEFAAMNEIYATYFPAPAPARATIQAARLPRDVRVEIDLIAIV